MAIFTGTFNRNLDGKNRVLVPSELRDLMDADDRAGIYLIPGKKCLFLWPKSFLLQYASGKASDPFGNLEFNRSFYSRAIFKAFDGTGRIVLPPKLAERFPEREILVVGTGLSMEAWVPAEWEEQVGELDVE